MIFSTDQRQLRRMYVDAWRKSQQGNVLTPLETQIAEVISEHPEYHATMTEARIDEAFTPDSGETNPFLHMGLHLAVREQVATDRPAGIAGVFKSLLATSGDRHSTEHRMLDCLAETLWKAQRRNAAPDEQVYLERLRALV